MLRLFEVKAFEDLAKRLRDPELEGFTADNVRKFIGQAPHQICQAP